MFQRQIRQHPVAAFVLVTFAWTWSWDAAYFLLGWWDTLPVVFPRQWGLPIAAIAVLRARDVSLRTWLGTVLDWRQHPGLFSSPS